MLYLLLALAAVLLVALAAKLWQIWDAHVNRSPEELHHERELAWLNDVQANRVSDEQLTRPLNNDDAWQTMVQRGDQRRQRRRDTPRTHRDEAERRRRREAMRQRGR